MGGSPSGGRAIRIGGPRPHDEPGGEERLPAATLATCSQPFQIGHGGNHTTLQQDADRLFGGPKHERRAVVGPPVGSSLISRRLGEALFVGWFFVKRAGREQLALSDRDSPECDGAIVGGTPFIHVLPLGVGRGCGKVHGLIREYIHVVIVAASPVPVSVVENLVNPARLFDVNDT